jgi:nucleotide-binding universal stress UspA family protein
MNTIVVGVDGSEGSTRALRVALEEAHVRDARLRVVSAWHVPPLLYSSGWGMVAVPPDKSEFENLSRAALDKSLEAAGVEGSGVSVTRIVREGQAADVLCEAARGADLLVVGSRGLGGFGGLLLGSVSQQCAHHTPCPIMIVPQGSTEADTR